MKKKKPGKFYIYSPLLWVQNLKVENNKILAFENPVCSNYE